MHCVDLCESFQTHIFLQNLASIQPRTSPLTFARSARRPVARRGRVRLLDGEQRRGLAALRLEADPDELVHLGGVELRERSGPNMRMRDVDRVSNLVRILIFHGYQIFPDYKENCYSMKITA